MPGMRDGARPPRLACWLLRRLIGARPERASDTGLGSRDKAAPDDQPPSAGKSGAHIEESLAELFRRRADRDGTSAARRWYWRQVFGFALRRRSFRPGIRSLESPRASGATGRSLVRPDRLGRFGLGSLRDSLAEAHRGLRRAPGLSLMVVITLALGIGANTAVFSVVNSAILNPLPFEGAERIFFALQYLPDRGFYIGLPHERAQELARRSETLERIEVFERRNGMLRQDDEEVPVAVGVTTPGLFEALHLEARRGRNLAVSDVEPDAEDVVVLGEAMWRQRFGASDDIVGRTMLLDGVPRVVVGVADASIRFVQAGIDLWVPVRGEPLTASWPTVMAWRRADVSVQQVRAEMEALPFADERHGQTRAALHLPEESVPEETRALLYASLAAVSLVLLIGCVNVAHLMLTRGSARRGELAVRSALGAGRFRIAGELFVESTTLAVVGGALGVGLAHWCIDLLVAMQPDSLRITFDKIRLDAPVLAYAAGLSMLAGVIAGMAPILHTWRRQPAEVMRRGGSATVARGAGRFVRQGLLAGEVALSVLLLIGAGLLLHSLVRLQRADPGYEAAGLSSLSLDVAVGVDPGPGQLASLYEQLLDAVLGTGAVEAAALASLPPVHDLVFSGAFEMEGTGEVHERVRGPLTHTAPGYFGAMGIPIIDGRDFDATDLVDADTPVIVNQVFAERYFQGGSAVGRRFRRAQVPEGGRAVAEREPTTTYRIVGVAGNAVQFDPLETEYDLQFYQPLWNFRLRPARPGGDGTPPPLGMALLLRVPAGAPVPFELLAARLRPLGAEVDPGAIVSIRDRLSAALDGPRFNALLFGAFASIALGLASVGLYGVVAHTVQRRAREMGIRVAIGARAADVRRLVLLQGLGPVIAGIGFGLLGAVAAGRVIAGLLYLVEPRDPLVFALVPALLLLVAAAAIWRPALRATRVDPVTVLRAE